MDIKQKASLTAILSAFILAGSKFSVGYFSGSMAVISSGLDSLLDVFMSGINFFAITKAAKPADKEHPYGHTKIEDMAAVIQALIIVCSGSLIVYKAVDKFIGKGSISYTPLDLGVMVLSLAFSLFIVIVLKRVARKTESNPLHADALHYSTDIYSNIGAIFAIVLTYFTGMIVFDLFFAVIVGIIIIGSAAKILKDGIAGLMDRSIPDELVDEIKGIIADLPFPYAGFHKLRTRFSGSKKYLDLHLLSCRRADIGEAHALSHTLEGRINNTIKILIDITIHVEPCKEECDLTDDSCVVRQNLYRRK
jgi:ferrous-iron efflux pump FieF